MRPDLADGLQTNVLVQVDNRPVGTAVDLLLGSSAGTRFKQTAVTALVAGHLVASFPAVSLREGLSTLSATVTDVVIDPVQPAPVTATANVTVSTGRPGCDVLLPADHTVWSPVEDSRADLAGFQHAVQVQTSGGGLVKLSLTPISGGGVAYSTSKAPAGSGLQTVTFDDVTFTDGAWTVDAVCAATVGAQGRALPNVVTLNLTGPTVSITKPAPGAAFSKADFNGAGKATVTLGTTGGDGGTARLVVDCGSGATTYGPAVIPAGGVVSFDVGLVADGQEGICSFGVTAKTAAGLDGLPLLVSILADRSTPAPALVTPLSGSYGPTAPELDCANQAAPLFKQVQVSVTDPVPASGLQLTITGPSGTPSVWPGTPTSTAGGSTWTWPNVAVANGTSALSVKATDAAGNVGVPTQSTVTVRCVPTGVSLNFFGVTAVNGVSQLGFAQDKDHSAVGEQVTVIVNATAANGSAVRVCSNSAVATGPGTCFTAGYKPLATSPASPGIQGNSATFDVTVPEGAQQVIAEVDASPTDVSGTRTAVAHYLPPHVTALALLEDTTKDGALNQAELTAAGSTVNFKVDLGVLSFITGNKVEIFSTASNTALASVVAASNGPSINVPVPLAKLLGSGGYQSWVFYARVLDEAGNFNSTPGNVYPIAGETVVTLGTVAKPFIVAPSPTVTLTAPDATVTTLNAAADSGCSPGPCPGTNPLRYALSASTSAPDGSTVGFFLDASASPVAQASSSGGAVSNVLGDLANGAARSLTVAVSDAYGNTATSPGRVVTIDSVPPKLTLADPADASSINSYPYPGSVAVSAGGPLEAGQPFSVFSDLDGLVGSGTADGSSALAVSLRLRTAGSHKLYAQATDVAGNLGKSPTVTVAQQFSGAHVDITAPATVAGTAWFGLGTKVGTRCQPVLQTTTTGAPDGTPVTLFVAPTADCSGAPTAGAVNANVSGNVTTFTGQLTFANHDAGFLCAQVTVGTLTHSGAQQFACDLDTPTVSFTTPAAGNTFVAFGQTVTGATPNAQNDVTKLFTGLSFGVSAQASSALKVFVDGSAGAFASAALLATDTTKDLVQVGIPIAQGAASTTHTLTAQITAPSGNTSAVASRVILADISPPGPATPAFSVTSPVTGVVHVTLAAVPADDGTLGAAAPAWDIRYRQGSTPLDANTWTDPLSTFKAQNLAGTVPASTGTTAFDILLPADQTQLWVGVRAVDRVGNLGAFTALAAPNVSTAVTRGTDVTVPNVVPAGSPTWSFPTAMRVADVDGDGFDDVIVASPEDHSSDGRIYVFFGSAAGLVQPPMTLSGALPPGSFGFLGSGTAFDVGDFDSDGIIDIVAGETNCFSDAVVSLWKGSAIKAARAAGNTPAAVLLRDGANLLGGTVRAVAKVTGGVKVGSDLLVTNYTGQCGSPASLSAVVLPRGSAFATTNALFSTAGAVTVALPFQPNGGLDAAAFDKHGASSRDSLALSFVEVGVSHELRAFSGDAFTSGATLAWTSGARASFPANVVPTSSYGLRLGGGRDALGSATTDLAVSDPNSSSVLVYDGDALLTAGALPVTAATVSPNGESGGDAGRCAVLLPDLDGDGKAEVTGCADLGAKSAAYVGFGFSGAAPPWTTAFYPTWTFLPARGQKITAPAAANVWGQAVGAGHVRSASSLDLVVLSHSTTGSDTLRLIR